MKIRHSIRFKLAVTFAVFGAMISLILALGISYSAKTLGDHLKDETLHTEIDDFLNRRQLNPRALLPTTVSIQGFLWAQGQSNEHIPFEIRSLPIGSHDIKLNGAPYRVAVVDIKSERYFMLFNEEKQQHREELFTLYLISGALAMILLSALAGWWLAGKAVNPIEELARRVSQAKPEDAVESVAQGYSNDEVGQLASVFATYLKRMQNFIERERNFTSDVSHELRTPLTIVHGVLELLGDGNQSPEQLQHRIARIARANSDMVNLTTALLLMAREFDSKSVMQTCDVCKEIDSVIEMNRHFLNKETQLNINYLSHPTVEAESTLLGVVVGNLIRNSFTYTQSGSVSITVQESRVTIEDTGTGIRRDEIEKVFQRHHKGAESKGYGIGLSLAKRICDRYGWKVNINSAEGKGTSAELIFESK